MNICKQCGVELDDGMGSCPLCNTPVSKDQVVPFDKNEIPPTEMEEDTRTHLMRRVLSQITAVLLISGIVATLVINKAVAGEVTWSIYPITICLIILAYVSLIALWRTRFIFHLLAGWLISLSLLIIIQQIFMTDWPLFLALPIVSAVNIVGLALYFVVKNLKAKGLNVLALAFVSIAILSLITESIISLHLSGSVTLGWSVIVAACLLPVTAAILFMYFRTRNNSELQKIFHT